MSEEEVLKLLKIKALFIAFFFALFHSSNTAAEQKPLDPVDITATSIPVGVSGALFFGVPLNDWIVIGTAVLLAVNISLALRRAYLEVFKNGRK